MPKTGRSSDTPYESVNASQAEVLAQLDQRAWLAFRGSCSYLCNVTRDKLRDGYIEYGGTPGDIIKHRLDVRPFLDEELADVVGYTILWWMVHQPQPNARRPPFQVCLIRWLCVLLWHIAGWFLRTEDDIP